MATIATFRKQALSFPEADEAAHFDKTSFRVRKKIFANYNAAEARVCLKLPETDQFTYSAAVPGAINPVPNKWGKQGWTLFSLRETPAVLLKEALAKAYCHVAPPKLAEQLRMH
ncbi:MAG: MmcQ/YjbR family DNA-binding protein [Chitinophagaceae bacterium]|nr:MAG: MmcQ/YjbR family DNA-binding protein [Chitinophagaceae bacterium]